MHEIETKVLNIDPLEVTNSLESLGAQLVENIKLSVDWYGPKGLTHNGDDPWFLRVRTYSNGKSEVTWKGISEHVGASRQTKEINFTISDPESVGELFKALDLEQYAHQEKLRKSWTHKQWRFDLDQYPGMPAFLEIEGSSESHVAEAIELLNLQNNQTHNKGERTLVQDVYSLNWFEMRFL